MFSEAPAAPAPLAVAQPRARGNLRPPCQARSSTTSQSPGTSAPPPRPQSAAAAAQARPAAQAAPVLPRLLGWRRAGGGRRRLGHCRAGVGRTTGTLHPEHQNRALQADQFSGARLSAAGGRAGAEASPLSLLESPCKVPGSRVGRRGQTPPLPTPKLSLTSPLSGLIPRMAQEGGRRRPRRLLVPERWEWRVESRNRAPSHPGTLTEQRRPPGLLAGHRAAGEQSWGLLARLTVLAPG